MQNKWKTFAIAMMVLVLSMVSTAVFAGGADPDPAPAPAPTTAPVVFDERICGEPGAVTQSQTTRWTNIFTTADPNSDTGRAYEPNTPVTILGRDYWGCWISVQAEPGNGWIPVDAVTTKAVMDLPMLVDNRDAPPGGGNPAPPPPPPPTGNNGCVIPPSGPWPPCATGGNTPPPAPSGDECVIPTSGPWPPCATGGNAAVQNYSLTIINNSSNTVCFVYISPSSSEFWGDDWLGATEVIMSGASRTFNVPQGEYDFKADDCAGDFTFERYNVMMDQPFEWTLTD